MPECEAGDPDDAGPAPDIDVYICYTTHDTGRAGDGSAPLLRLALELCGYSVFLGEDNLQASWALSIPQCPQPPSAFSLSPPHGTRVSLRAAPRVPLLPQSGHWDEAVKSALRRARAVVVLCSSSFTQERGGVCWPVEELRLCARRSAPMFSLRSTQADELPDSND